MSLPTSPLSPGRFSPITPFVLPAQGSLPPPNLTSLSAMEKLSFRTHTPCVDLEKRAILMLLFQELLVQSIDSKNIVLEALESLKTNHLQRLTPNEQTLLACIQIMFSETCYPSQTKEAISELEERLFFPDYQMVIRRQIEELKKNIS